MQTELIDEARRQAEICNACRYCEGYCSVFPALHRERQFADQTIVQLANLCHNCRGCYYACQYTAPHEFGLNLPKALAEVRRASWEAYAWPRGFGRLFQKSGVAVAIALTFGFALMFAAMRALGTSDGAGFYAALSHVAMVAIFLPAFVVPLLSLSISLKRYWKDIGGSSLTLRAVRDALTSTARMKNLAGGHGDGCNFEEEDRFSHARRFAHQALMYGFLLCFAATALGTVMHYLFAMQAPYGFWSAPKLTGVAGGILMVFGSTWMIALKLRSDRHVGDETAWSGEVAFVLLLWLVAATGLALYLLGATAMMPLLLAVHLGAVLSFFLITPYSKMAHGFYRLTALILEASARR